MMRPMKLAGSELMFGNGSLEYIKSIECKKVAIVVGGSSMEKNGTLEKVEELFHETGAITKVIRGVEPDPSIETVLRGAKEMLEFCPDLIVGLGGGSAMDAAKAMWIFYEHPKLKGLQDILPPNTFPKLRKKARLCCIPSTSGTASEVSRSIVITENSTGLKYGIGNMEMMPDIAICDGDITVSMPAKITAETGMDALTHALEALVSNRANYLSDILAKAAIKDIFKFLPKAYKNGEDRQARELMLQASMVAGLAFTNVSLGIVHSMAHTLGSIYHISHGLADAIILPYVINYNKQSKVAKEIYKNISDELGIDDIELEVRRLNKELNIPDSLSKLIPDRDEYIKNLDTLAEFAKKDGCTKTNPVIPEIEGFKELFIKVYDGSKEN
ncbi:iron-containing alcohol dehydrogenase [Lachnoanaerobaculum saburreum]|nr:iron-containing alcohol dehydrogenase [Lachnoanaerobaculum saburreum]